MAPTAIGVRDAYCAVCGSSAEFYVLNRCLFPISCIETHVTIAQAGAPIRRNGIFRQIGD
jgi:hypothetical protein